MRLWFVASMVGLWFLALGCSGGTPGTEATTEPNGSVETGGSSDAGAGTDASAGESVPEQSVVSDTTGGNEKSPINPKGEWKKAEVLPDAQQETAVLAFRGEIYVIGGITGAIATVKTVLAYSPETQKWRKVADLPIVMHHANAVVLNDRIYVVGSLSPNFREQGNVYEYNPDSNTWTEKKPMPQARIRGASALGVIGKKIYVAGGLRRGAVVDFDAYDPKTETWETKANLPTSLDHLAGGVIDGKFYVAGGRNGTIESIHPLSYVYDPATDKWSEIAKMPTPRGGVAYTVHKGKLYVFGGEGNPAQGSSGVFHQAEVYDPAKNEWTSLEPMAVPVHGTGAASLGDVIYIPGGATKQAFGAVNAHAIFLPPTP
ncbi:MAG: kelch repeat-containing protein [Deltaproteobacteria bacterium]|nr:MAG: kelch repeat-containing protein [Deltaproteobacteria bacterium]